jgi:hypothetical protein
MRSFEVAAVEPDRFADPHAGHRQQPDQRLGPCRRRSTQSTARGCYFSSEGAVSGGRAGIVKNVGFVEKEQLVAFLSSRSGDAARSGEAYGRARHFRPRIRNRRDARCPLTSC